jgi:hypothetical protein
MKVSAVLTNTHGRWIAECEEVELAGEGDTAEHAVDSLREALREYFGHTEAVAPPPDPTVEPIEIVITGITS